MPLMPPNYTYVRNVSSLTLSPRLNTLIETQGGHEAPSSSQKRPFIRLPFSRLSPLILPACEGDVVD